MTIQERHRQRSQFSNDPTIMKAEPQTYHDAAKLGARVERVMAAKAQSGLSYDQIAEKLGVTNTYAVQLFLGQVRRRWKEGSCGE
jgi:ribosome-binding protein aMBF1 (putative translation factor)